MPTINASLVDPDLAVIQAHLGTLTEVRALGSSGTCWRVVAGERTLVVKRMPARRAPDELAAIGSALGPDLCPPLIDHVDGLDAWWAFFRWRAGEPLRAWSPALVELLPRLWACPARGSIALVDEWIERLADFRYRDAPAELLRRRLFDQRPDSTQVLAHGDFAPQNLLATPTGLSLVDWEQCGRAPAGFDAGWLAALVRARLVPGPDVATLTRQLVGLRIDPDELRWFEGLGLLRLLYRVRSATMSANGRAAAASRLRAAILDQLE